MKEAFVLLVDIILLGGIAWWIFKRQSKALHNVYWYALGARLVAGISIGLVYFFYYGQGDTISYWHDGNVLADKILSDPVGGVGFFWDEDSTNVKGLLNYRPRSVFFVKIVGILSLVTAGNYWMMAIVISCFSFLGAWYLFVKTITFFPSSKWAAAISFLFFPSIIFWSSGLIKECLGMAAIFFIAGFTLTAVFRQKIKAVEWLILILSVWIGWRLKYYWLGIYIPVVLTTIVVSFLNRKYAIQRFEIIAWMVIFAVLLLAGTSIHPNFYPHRFLEVIYQNNVEFMAIPVQGNAIHYHNLSPTFSSVLLNSPQALLAGLFRPFIWEGNNMLSLGAGIENLLLTIIAGMGLFRLPQLFRSPHRILGVAIIVYTIILAVFLALSTPNLGTLSRYKVGFMPFLIFILLYNNPLINRLSRTKVARVV